SCCFFFFSSRRRHTRFSRDWSSDVCSSDLGLFSGLDALLDVPLPQLLDRIALGEEMTAALLRRQGDSGRILECVLRYEQADWDQIGRASCRERGGIAVGAVAFE